MEQWATLTKISQVKKNDAVRTIMPVHAGKHWIYIVERTTPGEIYLFGGDEQPPIKILYKDQLEKGEYQYISLHNLPI